MSVRLTAESGAIVNDPARDVLADLLGAVGRGEELFLILERSEDTFTQVTLLDDQWRVERRAGGEDRHEVGEVADLHAALAVLSAWIDGTASDHLVDWRPHEG